jgi:hypothetical protein
VTTVLIPVHALDGHRQEFLDLFSREVNDLGYNVIHRKLSIADVFHPGPILSLFLEEHPTTFLFVSFFRSLANKRSVTLMFRPKEASAGTTLKLKIKRALLRLSKVSKHTTVFTILPFEDASPINKIANDWIYDPQLWDWFSRQPPKDDAFIELVLSAAKGRKILTSLGVQSKVKGFDFFTSIWEKYPPIHKNILFVCAGDASRCSPEIKRRFTETGGLLIDRQLTTGEIASLYDVSDVVWACYSPEYDQASGIFGRAFQLNVPAIIREGASLNDLANRIGYAPINIRWNDTTHAKQALLDALFVEKNGLVSQSGSAVALRDQSLRKIFSALALSRGL